MKTMKLFVGLLAFAVFVGVSATANAVCTVAGNTYFFSGDGFTTIPANTTLHTPLFTKVPVDFAGTLKTSNGLSTAAGCTTATATTLSTVTVYAADFLEALTASPAGGISCNQTGSIAITGNFTAGVLTSADSISTTHTSVPNVNSETAAAFCTPFVGGALAAHSVFNPAQTVFEAVETSADSCTTATFPCPAASVAEAPTDAVHFSGAVTSF